MCIHLYTVYFIKPYRNQVYKCTGCREGFMKWAIFKKKELEKKKVYIFVPYEDRWEGGAKLSPILRRFFWTHSLNNRLFLKAVRSESSSYHSSSQQTKLS